MSGHSESLTCPYCGYEGANANYDYKGPDNGVYHYCDVCDYYMFEPADDNEQWEEAGIKAGNFPPDETILPEAKKIAKFIKYIWESGIFDNDDEGQDRFSEMLLSGEIPKFIKEGIVYRKIIETVMP